MPPKPKATRVKSKSQRGNVEFHLFSIFSASLRCSQTLQRESLRKAMTQRNTQVKNKSTKQNQMMSLTRSPRTTEGKQPSEREPSESLKMTTSNLCPATQTKSLRAAAPAWTAKVRVSKAANSRRSLRMLPRSMTSWTRSTLPASVRRIT